MLHTHQHIKTGGRGGGHGTKTNGKRRHVDCYLVWRVRCAGDHACTQALRSSRIFWYKTTVSTSVKTVLSGIPNCKTKNSDRLYKENTQDRETYIWPNVKFLLVYICITWKSSFKTSNLHTDFMCVIPVVWYTISMAIYVRGTYRQTQLFYWLIVGRFTTTCFGPIPGPSSGLTVSATHIYCHTNCTRTCLLQDSVTSIDIVSAVPYQCSQ